MAVSEAFSDDELISQLRMFFDVEEADTIDFQLYLGQLVVVDENTRELRVGKRLFRFNLECCDVVEVSV